MSADRAAAAVSLGKSVGPTDPVTRDARPGATGRLSRPSTGDAAGYWLLKSYATGDTAAQRKLEHAKLTSMLLLGHTIATSGTLLKTGLVFGMNPAALNYSQIFAMAPATIAWFKEAIARDRRIDRALAKEWESLLTASERPPR